MVEFTYREMFPLKDDSTEYRLLTENHIAQTSLDGTRLLRVAPEGLTLLAEQAFQDASHFLRSSHWRPERCLRVRTVSAIYALCLGQSSSLH